VRAHVSIDESEVFYSTVDLRVERFVLCGEILYDKSLGIEVFGWRDRLVELCKQRPAVVGWHGGDYQWNGFTSA